jgi:hypothetical protein
MQPRQVAKVPDEIYLSINSFSLRALQSQIFELVTLKTGQVLPMMCRHRTALSFCSENRKAQ